MELKINPEYTKFTSELGISQACMDIIALAVTIEEKFAVSILDELFNMEGKEIENNLKMALQHLTNLNSNNNYSLKVPLIGEAVLGMYDIVREDLIKAGWNGNHPNQGHLGVTKWKDNEETRRTVDNILNNLMNKHTGVDFVIVLSVIDEYYNVDDGTYLMNMNDFFKSNFILMYESRLK